MLERFSSFVLLGVMILLLLAGCSRIHENTETTLPTETTAEPTESTAPPPTTLPPETTVPKESQPTSPLFGRPVGATDSTLRSLPLDMGVYCEAYPLGENILLCIPQTGQYQIRSLKDGSVLAGKNNAGQANRVTVADDQIIYYAINTRKITFLDLDLNVVKTLDFSLHDNVADMLFSKDGKKAYYCIDQQTVVELNLDTFAERVIPVYGPPIWTLSDLHFNDSILRFWGKKNGVDYYGFLKLDTGAYLGKDSNIAILQDWDNNYYLCRGYQGTTERLVRLDGSYRYLMPKDHGQKHTYSTVLPQLNSFFTLSYDYDSPTVILDIYDLNTKQRTSSLTVSLGGTFESAGAVFVDASGEYIWLCLKVGNNLNHYNMILYRWDFRANAIEDTTVYGYGG